MKKLTYRAQLWMSVAIVIAGLACSTAFQIAWLGNLGWVLSGMLHLFHPICPAGTEGTPRMKSYVRLSGVLAILLGLSIRFGI